MTDRSPLAGFVALLRDAGLAVGTERVLLAHQALALTGLRERRRLQAALRATLVTQADELPLFDAAFALYWQAPRHRLSDLLPALPPLAQLVPKRPPQPGPPRRLLEAITPPHAWRPTEAPPVSARLGASGAEAGWEARRFDELSAHEWPLLRTAVKRLARALQTRARGRRWQAAGQGPVDLAAALRRWQAGRAPLPLPRRRPRPPPRQVVWLGDVSGSMQESTRALLLWAHAQAQLAGHGQAGVRWRFWAFGTRLHALTPLLRRCADPDQALQQLADQGVGGSGGTRIGAALRELLAQEGPRLQAARSTLLLVSDGLDHAGADPLLAQQLAAWRRLGVRLIWLDPLAREHLSASRLLAEGVHAHWPLTRLGDLLDLQHTG